MGKLAYAAWALIVVAVAMVVFGPEFEKDALREEEMNY